MKQYPVTIQTIIELMQTDAKGISERFNIPLVTVYSWLNGSRTPPEYVLRMMFELVHSDIKED